MKNVDFTECFSSVRVNSYTARHCKISLRFSLKVFSFPKELQTSLFKPLSKIFFLFGLRALFLPASPLPQLFLSHLSTYIEIQTCVFAYLYFLHNPSNKEFIQKYLIVLIGKLEIIFKCNFLSCEYYLFNAQTPNNCGLLSSFYRSGNRGKRFAQGKWEARL